MNRMKITKLTTYIVPPRWCFLKIETDEGIVGWGEPVVEGRALTVEAAVHELSDYLIGKDPFLIEDHWTVMYRGGFYRGGAVHMSAISGIDQALWDIKGKALGQPVHSLLGGQLRDKIKVYSWIGGDRPSDVASNAKDVVARGFQAIKLNGCEEMQIVDSNAKIDHAVETIGLIREAVGPHIGIGVDFHGRVHKPMAKVLAKELDQFKLMFIEEPVLSENREALRDIVNHTSTPIALGERLYSRWDFKQILSDGYVDIIQPDLSHAGGITECRKIASMAEAYDVALAPHCPLGPIALAACLQEQSLGIHYNQSNDILDYIVNKDVFQYSDGYVAIPQGPGLGIEVDEAYVIERAKEGHRWRNPIWRHADGSFAEW
jgi:galactonate dehydratase